NAIVMIEGSKIREVGPVTPLPSGVTVLDLGDATLLPGFVDAHTHLTEESSENWLADFYQGLRRSPPEQALLASVFARRTLESGFTTVRNVGAENDVDVALRNAIEKGYVPGPR